MRWFLVDTFLDLAPGEHAVAVKNISLSEDHLHDNSSGFTVFPVGLMIEGFAQCAGILVGHMRDFSENVILAKVRSASFTEYAYPGDQIIYRANVESVSDSGAATSGTVEIKDKIIGEIKMLFSFVNQSMSKDGLELPDHNFVFSDDFLKLVPLELRSRQNA